MGDSADPHLSESYLRDQRDRNESDVPLTGELEGGISEEALRLLCGDMGPPRFDVTVESSRQVQRGRRTRSLLPPRHRWVERIITARSTRTIHESRTLYGVNIGPA